MKYFKKIGSVFFQSNSMHWPLPDCQEPPENDRSWQIYPIFLPPIAQITKIWGAYNAFRSPILRFGGHLFCSCALWSIPFPELQKNACFKNGKLNPVWKNRGETTPDGIRAFCGFFRKCPNWQTGHFALFSGSYSYAGSNTGNGSPARILMIIGGFIEGFQKRNRDIFKIPPRRSGNFSKSSLTNPAIFRNCRIRTRQFLITRGMLNKPIVVNPKIFPDFSGKISQTRPGNYFLSPDPDPAIF